LTGPHHLKYTKGVIIHGGFPMKELLLIVTGFFIITLSCYSQSTITGSVSTNERTFIQNGLVIDATGRIPTSTGIIYSDGITDDEIKTDATYKSETTALSTLISPLKTDTNFLNKVTEYGTLTDTEEQKKAAKEILGFIHADVFPKDKVAFPEDENVYAMSLGQTLASGSDTKKFTFACETSAYVYVEALEEYLKIKPLPVVFVRCESEMLHTVLKWKISDKVSVYWETSTGLEATPDDATFYQNPQNCTEVALGDKIFYSLFFERYGNASTDYDKRIAAYKRAIDLSPLDSDLYLVRCTIEYEKGNYVAAIADCNQSLTMDSKFAPAYYMRGKVKSDQGDYDGAIADYDQAISQGFKVGIVLVDHGQAEFRKGKYTDAINDFDKSIALTPNNKAYFDRGLARTALLGSYDSKAISDFDTAIILDPTYAPAYYERGLAKAQNMKFAEAMVDFDKAIDDLKYETADAYSARGCTKYNLGKRADSLIDINKAIELFGPALCPPSLTVTRGFAECFLQKYAEAIVDFTKAITGLKLGKTDLANAYYYRGFSEAMLANYIDAKTDRANALLLNPIMSTYPDYTEGH